MYYLVNVDITAWQCISTVVNVKGFQKYCIFNTVHEKDDNMLWNGSKEDGNVRSACEENEDTDYEDGDRDTDWQMYRESDMFCVLRAGK
jgi:hypothetical protein